MYNTINQERGQNLFQTSNHTAHHWRDGYYFPSSNFQPVKNNPIPPALNYKDEVTPEVHYTTTNKTFHDNKYPNQDLYNVPVPLRQVKAQANYHVNYIGDVVEKLNSKPRRPLTMAFQTSEYKNNFDSKDADVTYEFDRPLHSGPKNYLISDELYSGPTKFAVDGSERPTMPPRKFDPSEQGVFNLLDPYLTSYNKEHRKFKPTEVNGIGKKDAITIYDTEEAIKTNLGFGTKMNPIPNNDIARTKTPMRDELWFKSEAKQRFVHKAAKAVPNGGLTTEARDNYKVPADVKQTQSISCPIDTPYTLPNASTKSIYATSGMYTTEYDNIGSGKIVTIPDMKEKNF